MFSRNWRIHYNILLITAGHVLLCDTKWCPQYAAWKTWKLCHTPPCLSLTVKRRYMTTKRTCLLTQASPFMKADCSAPLVLPQSSPAFAIRAIALLAHTGLPVRYPWIRSCKHGSFAAAVRDFHSKKRICPQQTYPLRSHYEKTLFLYPYVGIIQIRLRVWEPYPTLSQLLPAPLFQFFTIIVRFCLVFN